MDNVFTSESAPPVTVVSIDPLLASSGINLRLDLVPGVPIYQYGDQYPGGKRINPAAFTSPPFDVAGNPTRQGTLGRNSLRGLGVWQLDTSLRRQFNLTERVNLQLRADFFNVFNHPNFGGVNTSFSSRFVAPTFGQATQMLGRSLGRGGLSGGFNPLFQIGGPRSTQLSIKLVF